MNNAIEINGILLNNDTIDVLKRWQDNTGEHKRSDPERYVEYLNDTQDCLTRMMLDRGLDVQDLADLLTKLICIKDDLKQFITMEKGGIA